MDTDPTVRPARRVIHGWLTAATFLALTLGAGCARRGVVEEAPEVKAELVELRPQPLEVGESELVLRLTDQAGQPIEAAEVQVRGDMTHPGMLPVLAEAQHQGEGLYRVALEWTMAGDWVLTVSGTVPDGRYFEERIEIAIAGE